MKERIDKKTSLLWYGTGHWISANIVEKGIGKLSANYMQREDVKRYKKCSVLTPSLKLALSACVKSCELETEEKLYLILCQASSKLMEEVIDNKVDKIPHIHYEEIDGNKILAIFISSHPSTGKLEESYVFSEAWGHPKWASVLEEQANQAGLNIKVSTTVPPTFEYIPPKKESVEDGDNSKR